MRKLLVLICAVIFCVPGIFLGILPAKVSFAAEGRSPVLLGKDSPLVLRVLTRAASSLYESKNGKVKNANLRTFQPFFVYTRPSDAEVAKGTGWYEVGSDEKGTIVGWLKGEDVFEWKQTICLSFTHPQGRSRVLMFDQEKDLRQLVSKGTAARVAEAKSLEATIRDATARSQVLPANFPISAIEPDGYVDINKQFYLLPILDHKAIRIDNREARLLRLAAATASGASAREKSDLRKDVTALKQAKSAGKEQTDALKNLKFDLIWVVDTTNSMQPWIDETINAVTSVSRELASDATLKNRIAFGLWGFRDSLEINGMEYLTKNFTPKLEPIDAFVNSIQAVKETADDSKDIEEDMFAGVRSALENTIWREGSIKVIIVVTDAPSHEAGHVWNSTLMDERTLRILATERKVTIGAMHLLPDHTKNFNKIAKKQLETLSLNPGTEKSFYFGVNTNSREGFATAAKGLVAQLVNWAKNPVNISESKLAETSTGDKNFDSAIASSLQAATITWLGSENNVQAPRDVVAYAIDKDLNNSSKQSLDVRLLITKNQLDDLKNLLSGILQAAQESQTSGDDFFASLQAIPAMASRNPEKLESATSLAKSGLIPAFLADLPYHSLIMDMSSQAWKDMSADEQDGFINSINSKIKGYQSLYDNVASWIALTNGDEEGQKVSAIPLDLLP